MSGKIESNEITTPDERIWEIKAFPIKDTNENIFGAIELRTEITERKKTEQKLKESELKYYSLIENLPGITFQGYQDFSAEFFRGSVKEITGYTEEDFITGRVKWNHLIIPKDLAILNEKIKKFTFSSVKNDCREYRIIKKDGNVRYIIEYIQKFHDDIKNMEGVLGILIDNTEKKEFEQKLKESKEKYRYLSEQSFMGIAIVQDNKIKYMNEIYSKIFGYTIQEMTQWTIKDLKKVIHPDDYDFIYYQFQKKQSGDIDIIKNYQYRVFKKDGDLVCVDNYSKPIIYEGKYADFITIVDITNRRKVEEALKESERKYRNAYNSSNLYKDLFTHDINNIFQNILSSIELFKLFSTDPSKIKKIEELCNLSNEQIIRGKRLVLNVQNLSKIEEIKIPNIIIEASKILTDVIKFIRNCFPNKTLKIRTESFQEQYYVKANDLLINLFENILFNAIMHNINVKIEILIKISRKKTNGISFIKFEFYDNGVGIPDLMKKEIFSRDYRDYKNNKVPSGIGLGLLLVKRIIDNYNGNIEVEDKIKGDYSKGSIFIVLIPEATNKINEIYC